ncbi:MAG: adenylosuccinate synthase [Dehalococcoidales bacterium]|nr:adenylosuccinate synthase [Dehalococcoidales bacterium]
MSVLAVVGAQWGDEAKGKIVDLLAEKVKMVVRYSGGDNAGHTVINQHGEFVLHIVPSGIFYPHITCIIGNGMAVNPAVLLREINDLKQKNAFFGRLFISDRVHLIMPYHILLDGAEEDALGGKAIGTTRKGIGPAFSDKVARLGIRAGDLMDGESFRLRLKSVLERKNAIISRVYGLKELSLDEIYDQYSSYGEQLRPFIRETTSILDEAVSRDEPVMLEGAQGTMLDPDFGTYPFGTSSSPLAGSASLGAGISPMKIKNIMAVFKAYCTRVGGGPMPTELNDETGDKLRRQAHEFGATTGRPRRCGWFDGVVAAYSRRINGYTGMALTRLDILDVFPELKICVAYNVNGKTISEFPSSNTVLEKCEPVYETMEGWMTPTGNIRRYSRLPLQARRYVRRLEEICRCPARIISVGPARDQTIIRTKII